VTKAIYITISFLLLLAALQVSAQDTEQGSVTIHSDPGLEIVIKKSRLIASALSLPAHNAETAPKPVAPALTNEHQPVQSLQYREPKTLYNGPGFRVQIYNGPDRNKAMSVKTEFMRRFPGVHSYIIYNSPGFRVKVGDFRNRGDAEGMLREANSIFRPSMIVPDVVTISAY
jgi:hypothetical protein